MQFDIHADLYGTTFSPERLELMTGLLLSERTEVGEIGKCGKYNEKPVPYGSATLRPTRLSEEYGPQLDELLTALERHSADIRQCGASDIVIWFVSYANSDEQRNYEFSPAITRRISALGITLAVSHYKG